MLSGYRCARCGGEWAVGIPPGETPSKEILEALAECPYCSRAGTVTEITKQAVDSIAKALLAANYVTIDIPDAAIRAAVERALSREREACALICDGGRMYASDDINKLWGELATAIHERR